MKNFITYILFSFLLLTSAISFAQKTEPKKIDYTSDRSYKDEAKYPGAFILAKIDNQVYFNHEGIEVWCDQAIFYKESDFFKAYGNVKMKQGDTINMTSDYAEYNGQTKFAFASTDVKLTTPSNTLTTDTLFFDRIKQESFYRSGGKVKDTASTITSVVGRYFMEQEKYSFKNNVVVTNPDYVINSQQLDFYSATGNAYLYGPSTITSENNKIYCERGYYDTRNDKGYFVKNSTVYYDNRKLEGDSIYFNQAESFASATNNIKVTDTANQTVIRGHYAEVFRDKDSLFITKRAIASMKQELDSIHIHSDTLMITGKPENRIIRGFYHSKLYKSDMNGKCDSIHINEKSGLTQMMGKPIVWSGNSQMTGDSIHLINDRKTEKMDTLKVFYNAFMIQKDSIEGYNQVKGKEMYGLFDDENQLSEANFIKNTETIYYSFDEEGTLIGINKAISSSIKIVFDEKNVSDIYYNTDAKNILYQESDFPENARRLRGFNWRGDEQIKNKEDLFSDEAPLQLPKIEGIPLPKEEENFFEERKEEDGELLNENSRLSPEMLQHRETDEIVKDSIPQQKKLKNIPLKEKKEPK